MSCDKFYTFLQIRLIKVSPMTGPASSFKPAVNARLYESPKGIPDVAYKVQILYFSKHVFILLAL